MLVRSGGRSLDTERRSQLTSIVAGKTACETLASVPSAELADSLTYCRAMIERKNYNQDQKGLQHSANRLHNAVDVDLEEVEGHQYAGHEEVESERGPDGRWVPETQQLGRVQHLFGKERSPGVPTMSVSTQRNPRPKSTPLELNYTVRTSTTGQWSKPSLHRSTRQCRRKLSWALGRLALSLTQSRQRIGL
jgi:hypothetical protein